MKKYCIYLFALTATVLFTACNNDDPVNKVTANMDISSRAIDGNEVVFSQNASTVELNYTDMTIQITSGFKDSNGQKRTLTTPVMKMTTANKDLIYQFSIESIQSVNAIQDFKGYIDLNTGMTWYTFTADGGTQVFSTSYPHYAYSTTYITNTKDEKQYSHDQSEYMFAIDASGEKCTFVIGNFTPNTNGIVQAAQIYYEGVTVTPTATGYTVTADSVESSYKGYYTISNLNFTLDNQCRSLNGHFTCDDYEFSVTGKLFPTTY